MQLNDTILEAIHGGQLQGYVTMTPRDSKLGELCAT